MGRNPTIVKSDISQNFLTLMMLMLQKNPDMRPSAEEILEFDWINIEPDNKELLSANEKITAESVKKNAKVFGGRAATII